MALEELYREVILDHYRNPRNRSPLGSPDATADGFNPLCGDEVTIELSFSGDMIEEISVRGHGCSISQSSGSMLSEAVKGKTEEQVVALGRRFREMLEVEGNTNSDIDPDHPGSVLGDLEALQGVRKYPVRIKCAILAWATIDEALAQR